MKPNEFKRLRKDYGIPAHEIARLSDLAESTVTLYEREKRALRHRTQVRLETSLKLLLAERISIRENNRAREAAADEIALANVR